MKPAGDSLELDWNLALEPSEFEEIRQLAHGTFGLDLKPGKEELVASRLRRLVRAGGFSTFRQYYRGVVADKTGASLAKMIDALATNHTSFMREAEHFYFLRDSVLPLLADRPSVDVWCAACSTGEEVWSLAMFLNEALPSRRISILATDISNKALAIASAAEYPTERCASLPAQWLSRYFVRSAAPAKTYRVAPRIREQATFRRVNLIESMAVSRLFPVIFCRNVMIYFDRPTQEQVVEKLASALEPGGHLFVGHAESLTRISHALEYVRPAVYRKAAKREGRWNRSS